MCGIICYIGNYMCGKIILSCLKNLLNRGYDSAGILSYGKLEYTLTKYACKKNTAIKQLEDNIHLHNNNNIGIGHTRWATHGEITDNNAHPHIDCYNRYALVHNGTIENYNIIKDDLIKFRYKFNSSTDSEVIVNLIHYYSLQYDTEKAITTACDKLIGVFALGIIDLMDKNKLYVIRRGCPLLISITEDEIIFSSEKYGFGEYAKEYYVVPENKLIICEKNINNENINNKNINKININYKPDTKVYSLVANNISKGEYKYWMEKEIMEQQTAIINLLKNRLTYTDIILDELKDCDRLNNIDNIILLGCGTSKNACSYSRYYFRDINDLKSIQVIDGADFVPNDIPKTGITATIFVSQSGETRDLYKCLELIKSIRNNNIITIGIINTEDSLIAREVDYCIYTRSGKEVAVASTKVFMSSVICLILLSLYIQIKKNNNNLIKKYINDLSLLKLQIGETLNNIDTMSNSNILKKINKRSIFILGKLHGEIIANEGALKIKEVAYIHAEGYSASSLKHGPFGLLHEDFPVILLDTNIENRDKINIIRNEILARDSIVITITNERYLYLNNENTITIPYNESFGDLLAIIPLQILALKLSIINGYNPDFPRNLAKVVTVE